MSKIRSFYAKYEGVILYLLFGAVTTGANFLVFYPLYNLLNWSETASNLCAWAVAVIVAFVTNKPFVFKSKDWSLGTAVPEFCKFALSRLGSGLLETALLFITVNLLFLDGNIMKLIISIIVVILNYIASKLFVFRK